MSTVIESNNVLGVEILPFSFNDEEKFKKFYDGLSDQSLNLFYHIPIVRNFEDASKRLFPKKENPDEEISFLAVVETDIIGWGRMVKGGYFKQYEVMFLVADGFQGKGIGIMLLKTLLENAKVLWKDKVSFATTKFENKAVHKLLEKFGYKGERRSRDVTIFKRVI